MNDDPPLGPKPRQSRGVAARKRVYEAAMVQFAEKGSKDAHVEAIVEEAGLSWGTFYRWFPRKQDVLLEAAALHVRERVVPLVEAGLADADKSSRETCLEFFVALLEPSDHPPHLHGEMLLEVTQSRERFTAMLDDGETPLIQLIARITAHGQQRGEVRTDLDQFTLAGTLMAGTAYSVIHGYYGAFRGYPGAEPAADLPELINRIFGIIWRGIEPAPTPIA